MTGEPDPFDNAVRAHDEALRRLGVEIWVGSEPTFTDRWSESPAWLWDALGGEKHSCACAMLRELADALGPGVMLRSVGRQYSGEEAPRWSLGLFCRRDGRAVWDGPAEPLAGGAASSEAACRTFWAALQQGLRGTGWSAAEVDGIPGPWRLVCRPDGRPVPEGLDQDPMFCRGSVHHRPIPLSGLRDELAEQGYLLVLCAGGEGETTLPRLEIPSFPDTGTFRTFLTEASRAGRAAGLKGLLLEGFPPPVDDTVAWTTLTPDPAVLEVNMAPAASLATFLGWSRILFAAAERAGLAPYRLYYNGTVADSGGGGQITLGGPTPERSPFFSRSHLLPRMVRYFNRHPCLSYWFCHDFVGGSGQSARPDERGHEALEELKLALKLLGNMPSPTPEILWQSLSPFLADAAGNPHRCELNIEKLWNPYLAGRGRLGLVEFRALRMSQTPERLTALAALLRAVVAMLWSGHRPGPLVDWGTDLHDRFALPFYLRRDLLAVFKELEASGVGLGTPLTAQLLDEQRLSLGEAQLRGCHITVKKALEFWPLIGDAASQDSGGSRLVDSSTARFEVALRLPADSTPDDWDVTVQGCRLPLRREHEGGSSVLVFGVRYRSFVPWQGLHPTLPAEGPIELTLVHHSSGEGLRIVLHEWRPDGAAYDGLPPNLEEARQRRARRFVVEPVTGPLNESRSASEDALSAYCLDLRRL